MDYICREKHRPREENLKLYRTAYDFAGCKNAVVTTGTFDGVHKGHRKIIDRLKTLAAKNDGETVMFTFDPHPRMVLFPDDDSLRLLNTIEEKISLLEEAGIDHLIIHPFSMEFSRHTALEYVRDLLVNALNVKTMVVGYDHHFGRNREGDFNDLVEFGNIYGFKVEEISALMLDEINVSSTKIRKAINEGDIQTANAYLGYSYQLQGTIVSGDGIGTKLGFPTANVKVKDELKLIPKNGVYAIRAQFEGREFGGMLNIGYRPTVSNTGEPRIEVHLFGFNEKIYDRTITLKLKERLRDEKRFESKEELIAQLKRDEQAVKAILHK